MVILSVSCDAFDYLVTTVWCHVMSAQSHGSNVGSLCSWKTTYAFVGGGGDGGGVQRGSRSGCCWIDVMRDNSVLTLILSVTRLREVLWGQTSDSCDKKAGHCERQTQEF